MATHSILFAWRVPMDRGAWWAMVHGVTKHRTLLSDSHSLPLLCTKRLLKVGTQTQTSWCFSSSAGPRSAPAAPCQQGSALTVLLLMGIITSGQEVYAYTAETRAAQGASPHGFCGSSLPGHSRVPAPSLQEGGRKTVLALSPINTKKGTSSGSQELLPESTLQRISRL